MKKMMLAVTLLFTCMFAGCEVPKEIKGTSLKAVITSDLHYTLSEDISGEVVELMPYVEAVTDAMVQQVIDLKPDVFIMTGDNTNSGNLSDAKSLVSKLKKLKDNGIAVIIIPGNHDYNQSTLRTYLDIYRPLYDPLSSDAESNSYSTLINDVLFLAMDDNAVNDGSTGTYSDSTMKWLKEQLDQADQDHQEVIFLSHHNVLASVKDDASSNYKITNEDLIPLLEKHHVQICFTGHQHGQVILKKDSLYEVITSMPLSGAHTMGLFEINDGKMSYNTFPIDFETYCDSGLYEKIDQAIQEKAVRSEKVFQSIFDKENVAENEREGLMEVLNLYMKSVSEGSLITHVQEIRNHPYYEKLIGYLWDYNYGPWIKSMVDDPPLHSDHLEIAVQ